jgi:hypothetical protein
MASITSVISLFVVLFVTYCHAVPIGQKYDVSTSDYEFTTDKPMFGRERPINMELKADEESTVAPRFDEKRKSYERDSEEYTTPSQFEKHDDEFHHKRKFGVESFATAAYEHDSDENTNSDHFEKLDAGLEYKRKFEDSSFTTPATNPVSEERFNNHVFNNLESSTEFNERATRYREAELEENLKIRAQRENEFETTTDFEFSSSVEPKSFMKSESSSFKPESSSVEPESSSSVDSFGKSTGFLRKDESEERPKKPEYEPTTPEYKPTTPEYEPTTPEYKPTTPGFKHVRPMSQPSTKVPVNKQRLTQTETIIPGKITETKIFANAPSQTYIVSEPIPVRQSQLSQGRSQSFVKKEVPDN